jgi:transketolase
MVSRMNVSSSMATGLTDTAAENLCATNIRKIVLEQSKRAGVGHIGSALCIAELLEALFGHVMNVPSLHHPDRDRFVLSKGHAALALYATYYLRGWISLHDLSTFCADGSKLGVHPEHVLAPVDFSTGSLGQGLSFGAGAALAAKCQKSRRRAFVLMSDAELNEGSVWEAVMFAAHHQLSNLVALVDVNGQQAFGYTQQVLNLAPLAQKFSAFGWEVHEVNGHDVNALVRTLTSFSVASSAPRVILAATVFGKGVSFMENQIKWHYSPLSEQEYRIAISEVSGQT